MKKKILILGLGIILIVALFILTGCNKNESNSQNTQNNSESFEAEENKSYTSVEKNKSYVGYYADFLDADGNKGTDGVIDGIIYADLAIKTEGQWSEENLDKYSYGPVTTGLKEYNISTKKYSVPEGFGEKEVITVAKEEGKDRFFVMSLEDINPGTEYSWYTAARKNMDNEKIIGMTENDFGRGKEFTEYFMNKWNLEEWGTQNIGNHDDVWGAIQEKVEKGWFLPSKSEWLAFGNLMHNNYGLKVEGESGKSEYEKFGLSESYWSSSRFDKNAVYTAAFSVGNIGTAPVDNFRSGVRLSTTF